MVAIQSRLQRLAPAYHAFCPETRSKHLLVGPSIGLRRLAGMVDRSGKDAVCSKHTVLLPADIVPTSRPISVIAVCLGTKEYFLLPSLLLPVGNAGNQDRRQRTKTIW